MKSPRTEDVMEFLVHHLATIPPRTTKTAFALTQWAHLFVPRAVAQFWQGRGIGSAELTAEDWEPFYSAAWELARIGVLRPGQLAPGRDNETAKAFGDHWSITEFGFDWLADAAKRPYVDMGRMANMLRDFIPQFGEGFGQRAIEAVRTYRTCHYLSACTMAGAAAESILLRVAIAKSRDEEKILQNYSGQGGRGRISKYVVGQATPLVKTELDALLGLLHYWRDDAAHGKATTITEAEAYTAIGRLLRLAQLTSDRWDDLTAYRQGD
jgi:hypothetical protein